MFKATKILLMIVLVFLLTSCTSEERKPNREGSSIRLQIGEELPPLSDLVIMNSCNGKSLTEEEIINEIDFEPIDNSVPGKYTFNVGGTVECSFQQEFQ